MHQIPIKEIIIILAILCLIWIPLLFEIYNVITAIFITIGVIIGGYLSTKFLK